MPDLQICLSQMGDSSIKTWQIATRLTKRNAVHFIQYSLQWRHNGCDGVSHHQPYECLLNRLYRRRTKKTSKLRVTGLCAGNSPVTGEFPTQMASNAENIFIWWRHHVSACCFMLWSVTDPITSIDRLFRNYWHWRSILIRYFDITRTWGSGIVTSFR